MINWTNNIVILSPMGLSYFFGDCLDDYWMNMIYYSIIIMFVLVIQKLWTIIIPQKCFCLVILTMKNMKLLYVVKVIAIVLMIELLSYIAITHVRTYC